MVEKQNGVCAICGNPETATSHGTIRRLSVDHDHETGEVRGLLCSKCNFALGLFYSEGLLNSAKDYLRGYVELT